jgi:hypothetical protein
MWVAFSRCPAKNSEGRFVSDLTTILKGHQGWLRFKRAKDRWSYPTSQFKQSPDALNASLT